MEELLVEMFYDPAHFGRSTGDGYEAHFTPMLAALMRDIGARIGIHDAYRIDGRRDAALIRLDVTEMTGRTKPGFLRVCVVDVHASGLGTSRWERYDLRLAKDSQMVLVLENYITSGEYAEKNRGMYLLYEFHLPACRGLYRIGCAQDVFRAYLERSIGEVGELGGLNLDCLDALNEHYSLQQGLKKLIGN